MAGCQILKVDHIGGETAVGERRKRREAMAVRSGFMGRSFVESSKLKGESSKATDEYSGRHRA
jgi:hypothetical protein